MSYASQTQNSGVYTGLNTETSQVNSLPSYTMYGDYYTSQCPPPSTPGQMNSPLMIVSTGRSSFIYAPYSRNTGTDANYGTLNTSYPPYPNPFCLTPLIQPR